MPLIAGIAAKLFRSKYIFSEYQSVACAGLKALAGQPLYALNLQCEGMRAASFVYIPGVAQVAAFFEHWLTEPGFLLLYSLLFIISAAALIYVPIWSHKVPGHWREKLPFAVFLTSSGFMLGNIAVILHAVVVAGALAMEVSPWLFVAGVVAAAWVKPTFLTYLVVILLLNQSWKHRLVLIASGIIAGLLPLFAFMLTGGEVVRQWYALLSHYVYDVTPGIGFFGWLQLAGLNSANMGAKLAYLVYAGLIILSGMTLVRAMQLKASERLWLGMSLAVLLIPRIMAEDICLLGPGLLVIASRAKRTDTAGNSAQVRGSGIVMSLCVIALAGALSGLADYSEPLVLLGFSLFILGLSVSLSGFSRFVSRLIVGCGIRKSGSAVN